MQKNAFLRRIYYVEGENCYVIKYSGQHPWIYYTD